MAPRLAAQRIEATVRTNARGEGGVSASVGSFPVVARLVVTSRVSRVSVRITDLGGIAVPIATLTFILRDVTLDRGALLSGKLRITDAQSGTETASFGGRVPEIESLPRTVVPCRGSLRGRTVTCAFTGVPDLFKD